VRTTTGHGRRAVRGSPNIRRTKRSVTPPNSPPMEGYGWLFKREQDPAAEQEHNRERNKERTKDSERRKEGYEWLFE
jgi:hypothetical protein